MSRIYRRGSFAKIKLIIGNGPSLVRIHAPFFSSCTPDSSVGYLWETNYRINTPILTTLVFEIIRLQFMWHMWWMLRHYKTLVMDGITISCHIDLRIMMSKFLSTCELESCMKSKSIQYMYTVGIVSYNEWRRKKQWHQQGWCSGMNISGFGMKFYSETNVRGCYAVFKKMKATSPLPYNVSHMVH